MVQLWCVCLLILLRSHFINSRFNLYFFRAFFIFYIPPQYLHLKDQKLSTQSQFSSTLNLKPNTKYLSILKNGTWHGIVTTAIFFWYSGSYEQLVYCSFWKFDESIHHKPLSFLTYPITALHFAAEWVAEGLWCS